MRRVLISMVSLMFALQGCGAADEPLSWGGGGKSEEPEVKVKWDKLQVLYENVNALDTLSVNVPVPKSPFVFWMAVDLLDAPDLQLLDMTGSVVYQKDNIRIGQRTKTWDEGVFNLTCKQCQPGTATTLVNLAVLPTPTQKPNATVRVLWSVKHCPPDSIDDGGLCEAFANVHDNARAEIVNPNFCERMPPPLKLCRQ